MSSSVAASVGTPPPLLPPLTLALALTTALRSAVKRWPCCGPRDTLRMELTISRDFWM
eukprot:CAMPEP_0182570298 /NCGR_PEP_ID=MMETSP1324-20130603/10657_1 /TAXON_ID=236786 /ORGANISM="Florenciella sp., Strain RCC1587" /LENGTH=57 /DNA_ID=CAMNT_0024784675 /DNA_START=364 /DNA_END=537 /DNA_ORIENTATION=+